MVATRGPSEIAASLNTGGIYRAVGGSVDVLLSLVVGGLFYKTQKKSIGMLLVPAGRELTLSVVSKAVDGKITPHLEAVLPLTAVPDALRRTGVGEIKGKLVIKP